MRIATLRARTAATAATRLTAMVNGQLPDSDGDAKYSSVKAAASVEMMTTLFVARFQFTRSPDHQITKSPDSDLLYYTDCLDMLGVRKHVHRLHHGDAITGVENLRQIVGERVGIARHHHGLWWPHFVKHAGEHFG